MVSRKRMVVVAGGLMATMALYGCAQNGAGSYGAANRAVPVNADVTGSPSATSSPSASPVATSAPAGNLTATLTAMSLPQMGQVVTDDKGWVLYRFDKDTANPPASACAGKCAQVWPPVLADQTPTLSGVDQTKVGSVRRADGGNQVTLGGWPLYRYVGDLKPGQWKGQAVGGTWWVISPDGKKNLTCLPSVTPTAVEPPASPAAGAADNNAGGGYGY